MSRELQQGTLLLQVESRHNNLLQIRPPELRAGRLLVRSQAGKNDTASQLTGAPRLLLLLLLLPGLLTSRHSPGYERSGQLRRGTSTPVRTKDDMFRKMEVSHFRKSQTISALS
ncbi:uncharacterized protein V6R79_021315 [Siganus canaliculatus]